MDICVHILIHQMGSIIITDNSERWQDGLFGKISIKIKDTINERDNKVKVLLSLFSIERILDKINSK